MNEAIRASELRVIDETGKNLGAISKDAALALARTRGLDLIEISPNTVPPVARIMSFDKFRYEEEQKLKKQRANQRGQELKQIQISVRAAKNDLEIKAKKVNEFLGEGHPVEIIVVLRGREKAHQDLAMGRLKEFLTMVTPEHRVIAEPKKGTRGINVQIVKK